MEIRVNISVTKFVGMCVDYNEAKLTLNISYAPLIHGSLRSFGLADVN